MHQFATYNYYFGYISIACELRSKSANESCTFDKLSTTLSKIEVLQTRVRPVYML